MICFKSFYFYFFLVLIDIYIVSWKIFTFIRNLRIPASVNTIVITSLPATLLQGNNYVRVCIDNYLIMLKTIYEQGLSNRLFERPCYE